MAGAYLGLSYWLKTAVGWLQAFGLSFRMPPNLARMENQTLAESGPSGALGLVESCFGPRAIEPHVQEVLQGVLL